MQVKHEDIIKNIHGLTIYINLYICMVPLFKSKINPEKYDIS
jgi:hypothetical protein